MNRLFKNVLIISMLSLVTSFSGCNKADTGVNSTINIEQNSNEYESASVVDFTKPEDASKEAGTEENAANENWMTFANIEECQEHFATVVGEQMKADGISYTGKVNSIYAYYEDQLCYYVVKEDGFPELYLVFLDEFVNRMDGAVTVKDYVVRSYRDIFSYDEVMKAEYGYSYVYDGYRYQEETLMDALLYGHGVAENKELFSKLSDPVSALSVWFNIPEGARVTDYVEMDGRNVVLEFELSDAKTMYIYMQSEDDVFYPQFFSGVNDGLVERFVTGKKQRQFLDSLTMADIENAQTDKSLILNGILNYEERLYLLDECEGAAIYAVPGSQYVVFVIGDELFYKYIPWVSPRFSTPRFDANDYDGDGETEYFFICTPNTGTGESVDDVYYIDLENGEYVFKTLDTQVLLDFIDDRLNTNIIEADGKVLLSMSYGYEYQGTYDISKYLENANATLHFVTYGDLISYSVDSEGIKMKVISGLMFNERAVPDYGPEIVFDIKLKWVEDHFVVADFKASSEECQIEYYPYGPYSETDINSEELLNSYPQYAYIVNLIRTEMIKEDFCFQTLTDNNISYMMYYASKYIGVENKNEGFGYALIDLDGNGIHELLLGENAYSGWDSTIYNIYTMDNNRLVEVAFGGDRKRYFLTQNGAIGNEGSGGAEFSYERYYDYINGQLLLRDVEEVDDSYNRKAIKFTLFEQ